MKSNKNYFQSIDKKLALILLVALFLRFFYSWKVPSIHVDEGYAFYSAKCLLNYGQDIWGKELSVYSSAWGGGMSMGYIYFSIPFLALFGQTLFVFRIPMILMGVLAVYYMYRIGCFKDKKMGYGMALLYATVPWSIMQQRWALDCNFFIVLFIPGLYYMLRYLFEDDKKSLYISLIVLGLSLYGYALAYLYVPVTLLIILIVLIFKKELIVKDWLLPCFLMFLIALPLMAFVFNNLFDLNMTNFWIFDFPYLPNFRSSELGFSSINIKWVLSIALLGTDNYVINSYKETGLLYYWLLPFLYLGVYRMYFKEKNEFNFIMKLLFTIYVLIPLFGFADVNAYKMMLYIIPAIYCIYLGLNYLTQKNNKKLIKILLPSLYGVGVIFFFVSYIFNHDITTSSFQYNSMAELTPYGLSNVINYTEENYPNDDKFIQYRRTFLTPVLFNELNVNPLEGDFEREDYYHQSNGKLYHSDFGRVKKYTIFRFVEDGKLTRDGKIKEEVGILNDSLIIGMRGAPEFIDKETIYCSYRYCLYK